MLTFPYSVRLSLPGILFIAILLSSCTPFKETATPRAIWVSAYYAGWMQGCGISGHLSPDHIDYSAVTHILHFSVVPGPDGSIDYKTKCLSPENSAALINEAHASGKKVLISLGGWLSEPLLLVATSKKAFLRGLKTNWRRRLLNCSPRG